MISWEEFKKKHGIGNGDATEHRIVVPNDDDDKRKKEYEEAANEWKKYPFVQDVQLSVLADESGEIITFYIEEVKIGGYWISGNVWISGMDADYLEDVDDLPAQLSIREESK